MLLLMGASVAITAIVGVLAYFGANERPINTR